MTAPTIEQLPVRVPGRSLPPPLMHSGCLVCTGPKRAFCGRKVSDAVPDASTASTTCVVCVELEQAHNWAAHIWGPA